MTFKLIILFFASFFVYGFAQRLEIHHKNFTLLANALTDSERFFLKFNETFNFPSLAFGLSVKNKPVIKKVWGRADLENNVLAKLSTKYRLASVSKSFTSAILGTLVDKGLVHYDDPLSKYLNESIFPAKQYNNKTATITLRHLLSHSAGVHVMEDILKDLGTVVIAQNVTQTIAKFKDLPLQFQPGSHFNYSNYGFQLIGAVIESVTKKPYQVVASEFFCKGGLNSTFIGNMSVVLQDVPRYYTYLDVNNKKENIPSVPFDELVFVEGNWPAGGYISTIDDLLAYGQLLIDSYKGRPNAILSQKTIKEIWTPQISPPNMKSFLYSDYGFGWMVAKGNNQLKHQHAVWHSGGLIGASSMLFIYPDEEIVGVALSNKGNLIGLDQMIVYAVENLYHLVK